MKGLVAARHFFLCLLVAWSQSTKSSAFGRRQGLRVHIGERPFVHEHAAAVDAERRLMQWARERVRTCDTDVAGGLARGLAGLARWQVDKTAGTTHSTSGGQMFDKMPSMGESQHEQAGEHAEHEGSTCALEHSNQVSKCNAMKLRSSTSTTRKDE